MIKGRVKWFDAAKGYGFVVAQDTDGDILLHANVLRNFGRGSVAEGAEIVFSVQETERGRQAAEIFEIHAPIETAGESFVSENAIPLPDVEGVALAPARVKWFDKAKGFGFANTFGSSEDIFLHMEVMRQYGFSDLSPGEAITVQVVDGPRGRMAGSLYSWDKPVNGST
ncbi:MAG: cold shock domain-containing protein [Rhodobacteraceae bacterium]|nr:cold shock domain-containing protein [Paracoccaceae bacterium]